jgi:signal transduction histidine kinase
VRPGPLEDGLSAALRALVADSPVPVDVEMADFDTSEIIATTVYFVVAEAMANALKHARATAIGVLVAQRAGTLHVEVHDNGIGGASSGYGLTSVRDRVSSVGGNLSVHSPPGAGTRIKVAI